MLTALLRVLSAWLPDRRCAQECEVAALGVVIHERLDWERTYRRAWGDRVWRAMLKIDAEARSACREERE